MKPDYKKPRDGAPQMHKANCAECKRNCEVPFKPNGKKPVYCKDCHNEAQGKGEPREFKKKTAFEERPKSSIEERHLKDLKSDIESLHLKVDSLARSLKTITTHLQLEEDKVSLKDVMSDVGVIKE